MLNRPDPERAGHTESLPTAHLDYLGANYTLQLKQRNYTRHSGCFLRTGRVEIGNTEEMQVMRVNLALARCSVIFMPVIFHLSLYVPTTSRGERRWMREIETVESRIATV